MARRADRKIELLGSGSLFSNCNQKELRRVASLADEVDVKAGTVLTKEGRPGRECFIISDGKAEVTLRGKRLAILGPGDCFGEMSLLDHQPRAGTVTAKTPMQLFVLEQVSFWALVDQVPSVARKLMRTLAGRLREVEQALTH